MTLFVVATPIGHRGDISRRAVEVLAGCDAVLAEDTRHTRPLLAGLGVETPLVAFHDHTSEGLRARLVERLVSGETLALVSDAGTPCVSDPGYKLVRDARAAGVDVRAVPGACAVTAFISVAGLPSDRFQFVGFAPRKTGEKESAVDAWLRYGGTTVCYESPQRLVALLTKLVERGPGREVAVGRELTKQYEELVTGTATEVHQVFATRERIRGEIVVGVRGGAEVHADAATTDAWLRELASSSLRTKEAAAMAQRRLGLPKSEAYARVLALRDAD